MGWTQANHVETPPNIDFYRHLSVLHGKGRGFPTWKLKDIHKHASYHGVMTKADAKKKLAQHSGICRHCYLTRYSKSRKVFRLSVMRTKDGRYQPQITMFFEHFTLKIVKEGNHKNRYEIKGTQAPFSDIIKLLKYYQEHPISLTFSTIGIPVESPNPINPERQNRNFTRRCLSVRN